MRKTEQRSLSMGGRCSVKYKLKRWETYFFCFFGPTWSPSGDSCYIAQGEARCEGWITSQRENWWTPEETYSKSLCIKKEKNANVSVTLPEVYVSRPARTELRGACSLVPSPVTSVWQKVACQAGAARADRLEDNRGKLKSDWFSCVLVCLFVEVVCAWYGIGG